MKHILFIALILATSSISLFISCNNPDTPEPVIPIDSTTLKPEIKISYQILDSGYVQFNNSTDADYHEWITYWGYNQFEKSPKYWFYNGTYEITYYAKSKYDIKIDTTFYITITNSIAQIDTQRFVKGVVFGDSIDTKYTLDIQNHFLGGGIPGYDSLTPVSYIWPPDKIDYMSMADFNQIRGTDVATMRDLFKVGSDKLAKWEFEPDENGYWRFKDLRVLKSTGWQVFFHGKFESGRRSNFSGGGNTDETLDIVSVKEIYQPPIFPGLASTAFIVTFHYKATSFGYPYGGVSNLPNIPGKDIIDLTFDVKFNVYPKRVIS